MPANVMPRFQRHKVRLRPKICSSSRIAPRQLQTHHQRKKSPKPSAPPSKSEDVLISSGVAVSDDVVGRVPCDEGRSNKRQHKGKGSASPSSAKRRKTGAGWGRQQANPCIC
ncbi:unnamed protein product [Ectocarpus sp. 8 AP-2014]